MLIAGIVDEDKKAKTTLEIVLQKKIRRFETYRKDKILILVLHGD